ncbi:MAG: hypothetical protein JNJ85_16680 [Candidatus Kapabacteria bacterium]|nr:hypothetical protein [Candidatus Kapabacteria bacterium]MBX7154126.1 hypothetical protein [Bacteroidota bacterium]
MAATPKPLLAGENELLLFALNVIGVLPNGIKFVVVTLNSHGNITYSKCSYKLNVPIDIGAPI